METNVTRFEEVIGKTIANIIQKQDLLVFEFDDGMFLKMFHFQDCCESVYIDDVCGNLDDLVGTPLLVAESVSNLNLPPAEEYNEFYTWTFYKFATVKGYVTVKWYGTSNGYYSERVSTELYENEDNYTYGYEPVKSYD